MIRKPTANDVSRLAEIHVYGWRFAYEGIIPLSYLYKDRVVSKAIDMHKSIIENNPEHCLVYDDGIIRGFALHNPSRDEDMTDSYELSALYIEPAFQRQGFGEALLIRVEKLAKEKGFEKIFLWVLEENLQGRSFYEKSGYSLDNGEKSIDSWDVKEIRYCKKLS